jgi:hypothetical protein
MERLNESWELIDRDRFENEEHKRLNPQSFVAGREYVLRHRLPDREEAYAKDFPVALYDPVKPNGPDYIARFHLAAHPYSDIGPIRIENTGFIINAKSPGEPEPTILGYVLGDGETLDDRLEAVMEDLLTVEPEPVTT